jgi:hypothetical protein
MSYLRKPDPSKTSAGPVDNPDGGEFQKRWPALWEYLANGRWEDGSVRQRATLLFFLEDGLIKMCVTDRALERAMWCSSDDWDDLLDGCNRQLADDTAQWRRKAPFVPGKGKK